MARKPLIYTDQFPYHITGRSNNREWFYLADTIVWSIFEEKLAIVSERYDAQVISFVLMSNHFHLLMRTPQANVDTILQYLMREVSRGIGRKSGRINRIFGGRYKWCVINQLHYLEHVYKYVYRNPVVAEKSLNVESYPFSTLYNLWHQRELAFVLFDDLAIEQSEIPKALPERVKWLNKALGGHHNDLIRRGLRRVEFQLTTRRNEKKWVETLEYQK